MEARPRCRPKSGRRLALLVGAVLCSLPALACSATPAEGGAAGLTGEPVIIGGSGPRTGQGFNQPEQYEGLEAAVDALNADGGINGRPVQLEYCDGRYDPNAEINCARQMVAKKAVVVVDPYFTADGSGTALKILADAGIPMISRGVSPTELTAANSFPIVAGIPGWYYGAAAALVRSGAKNITVLAGPSPSAQFASAIMARALDAAGVQHKAITFDAKADPTGATAAAQATSGGVDGIGMALPPTAIPPVLTAIRQGGYTGPVSSISSIITPAVLQALGANADGMQVVSLTALPDDSANPGVARYAGDLAAVDGAQPKEISILAWSGVMLVKEVLAGQIRIDAASVTAALAQRSEPVSLETVGDWSFEGRTSPVADWPRLVNPLVQIGVARGATVVSQGGFVDPFALVANGGHP